MSPLRGKFTVFLICLIIFSITYYFLGNVSVRKSKPGTTWKESQAPVLEKDDEKGVQDASEYLSHDHAPRSQMNVLFLVSDDMRPEISSYYDPISSPAFYKAMHTPHLERLASKSVLLKRAYVQYALCAPSRASFLTGRRPDTTRVYSQQPYSREVGGNFTTLPQYFKENGYYSVGVGKIFHGGKTGFDEPFSWSGPYFDGNTEYYNRKMIRLSWLAVSPEKRAKHPLQDDQIEERAIEILRDIVQRNTSKPFFMAVGFHKPHLQFIFPEHFGDYYPLDTVLPPSNPFAPTGMPRIAWGDYPTLRRFEDVAKSNPTADFNSTLPDPVMRKMRRAYYSAVSYVDSMIGKLLAELDKFGLADSTIVSFIGDHGWLLGEHGQWGKNSNFELTTHTPMIVRIPGITDDGIVRNNLVEFVDLFPTLVEAAGLPAIPPCPEKSSVVALCHEGRSFLPLLYNDSAPWKGSAFSQALLLRDPVMGYSVRTDRYRYTEWVYFGDKPDWNKVLGVELYDHILDPGENINRANSAEYKTRRVHLSKVLRGGWRKVLVEGQR